FDLLQRGVAAGSNITDTLADLYLEGVDGVVEKDLREHVRLLELGVRRHSGAAAGSLALAEERGLLGSRDDVDWRRVERRYLQAVEWWEGDAWAVRNLATLYREGKPGVPKDLTKATYFYVFAAKLGDGVATAALTDLILSKEAVFMLGHEPSLDRLFY